MLILAQILLFFTLSLLVLLHINRNMCISGYSGCIVTLNDALHVQILSVNPILAIIIIHGFKSLAIISHFISPLFLLPLPHINQCMCIPDMVVAHSPSTMLFSSTFFPFNPILAIIIIHGFKSLAIIFHFISPKVTAHQSKHVYLQIWWLHSRPQQSLHIHVLSVNPVLAIIIIIIIHGFKSLASTGSHLQQLIALHDFRMQVHSQLPDRESNLKFQILWKSKQTIRSQPPLSSLGCYSPHQEANLAFSYSLVGIDWQEQTTTSKFVFYKDTPRLEVKCSI